MEKKIMASSLTAILNRHKWAVLTLGLAYGATVVFTFFGPVLARAAGSYAPALSLVAVACHVLAFYFPVFGIEPGDRYIRILALVLVPGVLGFGILPVWGQTLVTILFAWTIGRIGCFWTYRTARSIPGNARGRMIACSLMVAFILLYFVNMGIPSLSTPLALAIPAFMAGATLFCYEKMKEDLPEPGPETGHPAVREPPYFSFLLVVYIAGGFTYAGIFPYFQPWAHVDRFVNVVPFIFLAPLAGFLLDRGRARTVFTVGVVLLMISVAWFLAPPSLAAYLGTQGFLQAGWAFINVFGWYFSWATAARAGEPYHFPRGISAMLLGAALGAFGASLITAWGETEKSVYGIVALVPLTLALVWCAFFPAGLGLLRRSDVPGKN